jgi:hypothetical protein
VFGLSDVVSVPVLWRSVVEEGKSEGFGKERGDGMNGIKFVGLNRAEGPCAECGAVVFYVGEKPVVESRYFKNARFVEVVAGSIVANVGAQILQWSRTAPSTGGYDKVDFVVAWEGDYSYEGRFDMQAGGCDGGESFWGSLRSRIGFYACVRRPAHFNDEHWANHCEKAEKNGWKAEMEKVMKECVMP